MKVLFRTTILLCTLLFIGCASTGGVDVGSIVSDEDLGMASYIFTYAKPEAALPLDAFCQEVIMVEDFSALKYLIDKYLDEYQTGILAQPYVKAWLARKAAKIGISVDFSNADSVITPGLELGEVKEKLLYVCEGVTAATTQLKAEGKLP